MRRQIPSRSRQGPTRPPRGHVVAGMSAPELLQWGGRVFAQCSPSRHPLRVPNLAASEMPYTRARRAFDLYTFRQPEDALIEWGRRKLGAMGRADGVQVLAECYRAEACLSVVGLTVVTATDPGLLALAGIAADEWDPSLRDLRLRVADAARRVPSVGGLFVPALTPSGGRALVVFAGYITESVSLEYERVRQVPLAALARPDRGAGDPAHAAEVIDLAERRRRVQEDRKRAVS